MNKRLHALCDLAVSAVREYVGLHDDYDGRVQDLSLEGVRAGLAPGRQLDQVVAELAADHPDADGVLAEAQAVTAEAIAFTRERDLVPGLDGECLVGPAPPSRR